LPWCVDSTQGAPVRGEDDLGVKKRSGGKALRYTVPNVQKINTIAHTQYRASHIPPPHRAGILTSLGGFLPCPEVGWGRRIILLIFTLFRGSFKEVWPFFCWTERPQDYPRSVIQLLPELPMSGCGGPLYCCGPTSKSCPMFSKEYEVPS